MCSFTFSKCMVAYDKRHVSSYVPQGVRGKSKETKSLNKLEKKDVVPSTVCHCGWRRRVSKCFEETCWKD